MKKNKFLHQHRISESVLKLFYFVKQKSETMKGVDVITDEKKKKKYLQIDIAKVQKYSDAMWEDLYDVLIASLRKGQPSSSLVAVEKRLIKAGKL